jgi:hypothetical protein
MEGLSAKDLEILGHYARQGSSERYWNYLAQHPGADGYGTLALGMTRNDDVPGAVANQYAQSYAYSRNHTILTERGWEEFGQALVQVDYARRAAHFNAGAPASALNLPSRDVQESYAEAFARKRIDAEAWAPGKLLDAARYRGGDEAADQAWQGMLDHGRLGAWRGFDEWARLAVDHGDDRLGQAEYLKDLGVAHAAAAGSAPQVDPDLIQRGVDRYRFDERAGQWLQLAASNGHDVPGEPVTHPKEVAELDDARHVRLERAHKAQDIHPADPYRELAKSPLAPALVEASTLRGRDVAPALYDELKQHLPADMSEERLAQVALAAREGGVKAGHIRAVLVENDTVYVAGRIPGMLGTVDLKTPAPALQDTLQRAAALDQQQGQGPSQQQGPRSL